ncbi:MAG: M24 family metallopeptidase [Bradyrhizobium sp.]
MRLHCDRGYVERQFGCCLPDRFLMAVRSFDNAKAVSPLILEKGHRCYGLFVHVEKGNVEAAHLPDDITPVFYQPYYTFDATERDTAFPSLEEAIAYVAGGERSLEIDRRLPAGLALRLAEQFEVSHEPGLALGTVTVSKVSKDDVLRRADAHRAGCARSAAMLLQSSPHRRELLEYLDARDDDRFALLDRLMAEERLSGIIASSVLNVQEIAGIPMWGKRRPLAVLYGMGEIWLIEAGIGAGKTYPDLAGALADLLPSGRIGVEMDDLEAWIFLETGLDRREHLAADNLLRRWRDLGTLPDLAFYVITTRASELALRRALEFAKTSVAADCVTEMDAYRVYLDTLRGFMAEHAPGLRVGRTLTNFHSGARTIFPSNAAAYPLSPAVNTLKIDAGCLLLDPDGMLLGCSDIARTLCFDEEGKALYRTFRDAIRSTVIPGCREGVAGREIHEIAVYALQSAHLSPAANRLYPGLSSVQDYDRDTGHLLGRNNLSHLKFTRHEAGLLREGMIACCEYQWPIAGHAIAYEDTCLVTPRGGINLTVDESP